MNEIVKDALNYVILLFSLSVMRRIRGRVSERVRERVKERARKQACLP